MKNTFEKIHYDFIYLVACGVNKLQPDDGFICDIESLYKLCRAHSLEALVGSVLKQSGVSIPEKWSEDISKSVRKSMLFDVERKKILDFLEQNGIWYMPLKGVILKEFYPSIGMRQFADNDILYDISFSDKVEHYMKAQGYEAASIGKGNHDVYKKKPVYNFEMHRALFGSQNNNNFEDYYKDVKKRLIHDDDSLYGYHFSDEDFYVYIVSHAYKHYSVSGTGLRSLVDFYVYLKVKDKKLDYSYIERECKKLGIDEFEKQSRILSRKLFSLEKSADYDMEAFVNSLSEEEADALSFYFSSGAYGTTTNYVSAMVKKKGKIGFFVSRVFMPLDTIKTVYPILNRAPFLLPVIWVKRAFDILFSKSRRRTMINQFRSYVKVVRNKK